MLNAIKIPNPDGTFRRTDSPAALAAALGAGWAPTFAEIKPTDVDLMTSYVHTWAARLPWKLASPPAVQEYLDFSKTRTTLRLARTGCLTALGLPRGGAARKLCVTSEMRR